MELIAAMRSSLLLVILTAVTIVTGQGKPNATKVDSGGFSQAGENTFGGKWNKNPFSSQGGGTGGSGLAGINRTIGGLPLGDVNMPSGGQELQEPEINFPACRVNYSHPSGEPYLLSQDPNDRLALHPTEDRLYVLVKNKGDKDIPEAKIRLLLVDSCKTPVTSDTAGFTVMTGAIKAGATVNVTGLSAKTFGKLAAKSCEPMAGVYQVGVEYEKAWQYKTFACYPALIGGNCQPPTGVNINIEAFGSASGVVTPMEIPSGGFFIPVVNLLQQVTVTLKASTKAAMSLKARPGKDGENMPYGLVAFLRRRNRQQNYVSQFEKKCEKGLIGVPEMTFTDTVVADLSFDMTGSDSLQIKPDGKFEIRCPDATCGELQLVVMFDPLHELDVFNATGFNTDRCDDVYVQNVTINCTSLRNKVDVENWQKVEVVPNVFNQGQEVFISSCVGNNPVKLSRYSAAEEEWTDVCLKNPQNLRISKQLARSRFLSQRIQKSMKDVKCLDVLNADKNIVSKSGGDDDSADSDETKKKQMNADCSGAVKDVYNKTADYNNNKTDDARFKMLQKAMEVANKTCDGVQVVGNLLNKKLSSMFSSTAFSVENSNDKKMGNPSKGVCPDQDYMKRNSQGKPQSQLQLESFGRMIGKSIEGRQANVKCTDNPLSSMPRICAYRKLAHMLSGARQVAYNQDMRGYDASMAWTNVTLENVVRELMAGRQKDMDTAWQKTSQEMESCYVNENPEPLDIFPNYYKIDEADGTVWMTSLDAMETDATKQFCWEKIARVRCKACEKHMYIRDYNNRAEEYPCREAIAGNQGPVIKD